MVIGTNAVCVGALRCLFLPARRVLALDDDGTGALHQVFLHFVDRWPRLRRADNGRHGRPPAGGVCFPFSPRSSPAPGRQLLCANGASSSRHRRFAIATRCLACRRTSAKPASIMLQRSPPSPIRESVCGWLALPKRPAGSASSTGSLCAAQTQWPQTLGVAALQVDPRQACECTVCAQPAHAEESVAPHAAEPVHTNTQESTRLIQHITPVPRAQCGSRIDILSISTDRL